MPCAVNAHAYVNATFSMAVDSASDFTVTTSPSIVFGGISTHSVSIFNVKNSKVATLGRKKGYLTEPCKEWCLP